RKRIWTERLRQFRRQPRIERVAVLFQHQPFAMDHVGAAERRALQGIHLRGVFTQMRGAVELAACERELTEGIMLRGHQVLFRWRMISSENRYPLFGIMR